MAMPLLGAAPYTPEWGRPPVADPSIPDINPSRIASDPQGTTMLHEHQMSNPRRNSVENSKRHS